MKNGISLYVLSADKEMARLLFLCAEEEGYTVFCLDKATDLPAPTETSLVLWDTDGFPAEEAARFRCVCFGRERPRASSVPFLLRPFSLREVFAALSALLPADSGEGHLPTGDMGAVARGTAEAVLPSLTEKERLLFEALQRSAPAPVSRERLSAVWEDGGNDNLLQVTLCHLRSKLEAGGEYRLKSIRGQGYALLSQKRK